MKNNNFNRRPKIKTESITAKAKALNEHGQGVVVYEKKHIPVSFLLPGEEAIIDLEKTGKFYTSKIQSIVKESKDRVIPTCKYFYDCGGCQLQHMSYEKQGQYKMNLVKTMLGDIPVEPIILMDEPYYYRNKIIASVGMNKKNVITGFYKPFSHDIVSIEKCEIQMIQGDKILKTIRALCEKHKIRIYNEDTENGFLRHILIKIGEVTGEVLVTFVVDSKIFPSKAKLIKDLRAAHPEIVSITMNINSKQTSVVLGREEIVLFGDGKVKDHLCGYDFKISSSSFYQVNPKQTEKLYNKAMALANIQKDEIVLDTYSGIGTISILASKYAKQVYGVEISKEAIKDANLNAKINKIKNVRFVQSDATHAMNEMAKEEFHIDVLFLDPPREGSTPQFIHATIQLKPKKIIYISCNPETLARDLTMFTKKHYKINTVVPVDMFPHTMHVETIVSLVRK